MLECNSYVMNNTAHKVVLDIGGDICTVDIPVFTNGRFLRYDDNQDYCWVDWHGGISAVYAVPVKIVVDLGISSDESTRLDKFMNNILATELKESEY